MWRARKVISQVRVKDTMRLNYQMIGNPNREKRKRSCDFTGMTIKPLISQKKELNCWLDTIFKEGVSSYCMEKLPQADIPYFLMRHLFEFKLLTDFINFRTCQLSNSFFTWSWRCISPKHIVYFNQFTFFCFNGRLTTFKEEKLL